MIQERLPSERPRERCLKDGPECLSLRECLALVLGSGPPGLGCLGLAHQILGRCLGFSSKGMAVSQLSDVNLLSHFFEAFEVQGQSSLEGIRGLGKAKKAQLLASFELAKRYYAYRVQKKTQFDLRTLPPSQVGLGSSEEKETRWVSEFLKTQVLQKIPLERRLESQEWLAFLPVFSGQRVGNFCLVEKGCRTHVNVDPVELFAKILAQRPAGIFLFHNHPSGNLTPSLADHELTQNVEETCFRLGLRFYGHAIVSVENEYWIILTL